MAEKLGHDEEKFLYFNFWVYRNIQKLLYDEFIELGNWIMAVIGGLNMGMKGILQIYG